MLGEFEDWDDDRTVCTVCDPGEDHSPPMVEWSRKKTPASAVDPESLYETGVCDWCNSTSIHCRTCGEITGIYSGTEGEVECEGGCGLTFKLEQYQERKGETWTSIRVLRPPD